MEIIDMFNVLKKKKTPTNQPNNQKQPPTPPSPPKTLQNKIQKTPTNQ